MHAQRLSALILTMLLTGNLMLADCVHTSGLQQGGSHNQKLPKKRARRRQSQFKQFHDASSVTEIPLQGYDWRETEQGVTRLLEAAMGPEVAYWKRRRLSCSDVAHTVKKLHHVFPDTVRVVLIRNQTWYFLDADPGGSQRGSSTSASSAPGPGSGGGPTSRYDWPALVASPYGTCSSPCQGQLRLIHKKVSGCMAANASRTATPGSSSGSHRQSGTRGSKPSGPHSRRTPPPPPQNPAAAAGGGTVPLQYQLPDMVFVLNAADNMQRFGANSQAPVLSLLKWWMPEDELEQQRRRSKRNTRKGIRAPDPPPPPPPVAAAFISLGRINGRLVTAAAPKWPSHVAAALRSDGGDGRDGGGSGRQGSGGGSGGAGRVLAGEGGGSAQQQWGQQQQQQPPDPLWDLVRRFVERRSLDLPAGVDADWPPPQPSSLLLLGNGTAAAAAAASAVSDSGAAAGRDGSLSSPREANMPRKSYDMDLLMPTMAVAPHSLAFFPWKDKTDVAFFRGVCYCPLYLHPTHPHICPRALLANVSGQFPELLDVGLVRRFQGRLGAVGPYLRRVTIPRKAAAHHRDHARYRYLLQLDGMSGSYRMAVLMATDSVILKSRSPYIEYYSRLQVPGAHYLEFWKDPEDPLDVLTTLRQAREAAAADPEGVAAAAAANQAIAASYLGATPRMVYARAVLLAYHALIPDMADCVHDLVGAMERAGHPLPDPPPSPPPPPQQQQQRQQHRS